MYILHGLELYLASHYTLMGMTTELGLITDKVNMSDKKDTVDELTRLLADISGTIHMLELPLSLKRSLYQTLTDANAKLDELKGVAVDSGLDIDAGLRTKYIFKEFQLDSLTRTVTVDGKSKVLPPKEMEVLVRLASSPGEYVELERVHSTLTRLSRIRREFPVFKMLIKVRDGQYMLTATPR